LNTTNRYSSLSAVVAVVPFNQASKQDVEALVDYIYANLGMDLDYILPFAGIPENGREIGGLDGKSELAHGMMLVNLLRILGAVKNKKARRHFVTRPTQVIPNHGLFGNESPRYPLKLSSNYGPLKYGLNTSVWLVQLLGKSSTCITWFATFANDFQVVLVELALWGLPTLSLMNSKAMVFARSLPKKFQYPRSYASSALLRSNQFGQI
jgi:hypothetical protein